MCLARFIIVSLGRERWNSIRSTGSPGRPMRIGEPPRPGSVSAIQRSRRMMSDPSKGAERPPSEALAEGSGEIEAPSAPTENAAAESGEE